METVMGLDGCSTVGKNIVVLGSSSQTLHSKTSHFIHNPHRDCGSITRF